MKILRLKKKTKKQCYAETYAGIVWAVQGMSWADKTIDPNQSNVHSPHVVSTLTIRPSFNFR